MIDPKLVRYKWEELQVVFPFNKCDLYKKKVQYNNLAF